MRRETNCFSCDEDEKHMKKKFQLSQKDIPIATIFSAQKRYEFRSKHLMYLIIPADVVTAL